MATPAFDATEFLVGYCNGCEKQVLTYIDLGPDTQELRRCLHCEELIATELQAVTSAALEARGYAIVEARTCGNGGGCSAGGCGVRPRS